MADEKHVAASDEPEAIDEKKPKKKDKKAEKADKEPGNPVKPDMELIHGFWRPKKFSAE